jgi:hypothetical protein
LPEPETSESTTKKAPHRDAGLLVLLCLFAGGCQLWLAFEAGRFP